MENYTYIYRDEQGVPYYVGKGTSGRYFEDHGRIPVPPLEHIELFEQPSPDAAYEHERALVKKFGRLDLGLGTLMNLTDGGQGCCNPNQSARQNMSTGGRWAVESGHLASVSTAESRARGGRIGGRKNVESGQLASVASAGGRVAGKSNGSKNLIRTPESRARGGKVATHNLWHVKRGIVNPSCELCQGIER
jgi:hypothetical protein